ncbi:hypothetical protein U1Q18_008230, partial [Sarracenia purpurea var. burkii]
SFGFRNGCIWLVPHGDLVRAVFRCSSVFLTPFLSLSLVLSIGDFLGHVFHEGRMPQLVFFLLLHSRRPLERFSLGVGMDICCYGRSRSWDGAEVWGCEDAAKGTGKVRKASYCSGAQWVVLFVAECRWIKFLGRM